MLVLTRKYQEKIRIGENITITVLRTKGKAVRLGIEAPANVPVIRGELAFESTAAGGTASDGLLEATENAAPNGQRTRFRRSDSASTWGAESSPQTDRARVSPLPNQVALKRVPRDKVASVLPELVSGRGPLRIMMDRR
ncbi:MAG: carbon storage regulator [Pirellulales bacterium]